MWARLQVQCLIPGLLEDEVTTLPGRRRPVGWFGRRMLPLFKRRSTALNESLGGGTGVRLKANRQLALSVRAHGTIAQPRV